MLSQIQTLLIKTNRKKYLLKNWIRTGFISTIYVLIRKMYLIH